MFPGVQPGQRFRIEHNGSTSPEIFSDGSTEFRNDGNSGLSGLSASRNKDSSAPRVGSFNSNVGPVDIRTTAGGNQFVNPRSVDFSQLNPANVNFQEFLDLANSQGQQNVDTLQNNLDRFQGNALDIVNTDIQGIQQGLNTLAPIAQQLGLSLIHI